MGGRSWSQVSKALGSQELVSHWLNWELEHIPWDLCEKLLAEQQSCFLAHQSECTCLSVPPAVPLWTGLAGKLEECFSATNVKGLCWARVWHVKMWLATKTVGNWNGFSAAVLTGRMWSRGTLNRTSSAFCHCGHLYQIIFRHLCNSCQQIPLNKAQFTCLMSRALEIACVPFPWGNLWLMSRVTCGHSLLLLMSAWTLRVVWNE